MTHNKATTHERVEAHHTASTSETWGPIDITLYERLPFPVEVLPDELREFVESVATHARISPDAPALAALGAIGAAAANRVVARVGGELHPVHLWVLALLASGVGKTPMIERISGPMRAAQAELRARAGAKVHERRVDRRILQGERANLTRRVQRLPASNPDVAEERAAVHARLLELEVEIAQLGDLPEPTLICDDMTVPALVQLMGSQGGTMTLVSAEGSAFFRSVAGVAGSEPIEPVLQAYSGEPIRHDRVRRAVSIDRSALSLILGTQPTVVRHLLRTSTFAGRGLWERLLILEPAPVRRPRVAGDAGAFRLERGMFAGIIAELLARPMAPACELRFSTDAHAVLADYAAQVDQRICDGDLSQPHIEAWANKVRGNTIRLAAILHLAEQHADNQTIDKRYVESAIKIMTCCISHARHVLGVGADVTDTQAIIDYVRGRKIASISARDLRRALARQFPEARLIQDALADLEGRGLVRLREEQGPLGRPSQVVTVHPGLVGTTISEGQTPVAKMPEPVPTGGVSAIRQRDPEVPVAQPRRSSAARRPKAKAPTIPASDPAAEPVTPDNWVAVVRRVVEQLPADQREGLEVGALGSVEPRLCPTCGGTWFFESGGCCSCNADEEGRRRNLRHGYCQLIIMRGGEPLVTLTEWRSGIDAGLSGGAAISEMDRPVLLLPDGFIFLDEKRNQCPYASVAAFSERLRSVLGASSGGVQ